MSVQTLDYHYQNLLGKCTSSTSAHKDCTTHMGKRCLAGSTTAGSKCPHVNHAQRALSTLWLYQQFLLRCQSHFPSSWEATTPASPLPAVVALHFHFMVANFFYYKTHKSLGINSYCTQVDKEKGKTWKKKRKKSVLTTTVYLLCSTVSQISWHQIQLKQN